MKRWLAGDDSALEEDMNSEEAKAWLRKAFHVKTAKTLEEACKLVEVGFDYVTEIDGVKTSENASNITLLIPSVKN